MYIVSFMEKLSVHSCIDAAFKSLIKCPVLSRFNASKSSKAFRVKRLFSLMGIICECCRWNIGLCDRKLLASVGVAVTILNVASKRSGTRVP